MARLVRGLALALALMAGPTIAPASAQQAIDVAPKTAPLNVTGAEVVAPNLAGTVWRGNRLWSITSSGTSDDWTVTFRSDGVLAYSYGDGRSFANGTWRQNNQVVMMETNGFFSVSIGTINGLVIYGEMRNMRGETGAFKFERIEAPRSPD
jgi:hypothetical protein